MANKKMKTLTIGGKTYDVVDAAAVSYETQTLQEIQKTRARENIGAASNADIDTVNTKIVDLKAQGVQQTPAYANSLAELNSNGDPDKVYVLPDGYIYGCTKAPSYRNMLLEAVDANGNPYNNGLGWKNAYRLNSSGAEASANTTVSVTGFIPVKKGDVIRFANMTLGGIDSANVQYIAFYNSSKTVVRSRYSKDVYSVLSSDIVLDANNNIIEFNTTNIASIDTAKDWSDVAYVRISAQNVSTSSIVTINDVIEGVQEPVGGGSSVTWQNTGRAFAPPDYEDRIIALENANRANTTEIQSLKARIIALEGMLASLT